MRQPLRPRHAVGQRRSVSHEKRHHRCSEHAAVLRQLHLLQTSLQRRRPGGNATIMVRRHTLVEAAERGKSDVPAQCQTIANIPNVRQIFDMLVDNSVMVSRRSLTLIT